MTEKPKLVWQPRFRSTRSLLGAGILILAATVGMLLWLHSRQAPPAAGQTQTLLANDLRVTMRLDDTVPGPRVVDVLVHDGDGRPVEISTLRLRFSMPDMDMDTTEVETQPVSRGHFKASGTFFSMVGHWMIEAIVAREGQMPLSVAFAFPIAAPGEASGPLNPLDAHEPTHAAGRLLYQTNCAVCHGVSGKGDGPAAPGLRPSPGDFTQHMGPGKHTDGQVYLWIRDGYPNSAMPAWGQRLSDTQIWQLVTYLRTFGQPSSSSIADDREQPATVPQAAPSTAVTAASKPLPPLIFTRAGNIWRSDGSARPPQQLTELDAGSYAVYPATSPAVAQIAFVITSQGPIGEEDWPQLNPDTKLAVMRADGSELHMIWKPERGILGQPAWAPDGRTVYVAIADVRSPPDAPVPDRLFQIVGVDPATTSRVVLLEDAYDLTFSRDGQKIAFLRWNQQLFDFTLNVAAPDGSDEREVVSWGKFSNIASPRFSPDGHRLIFVSSGGPATDEQGYPIVGQNPLERMLGFFAPAVAEAHGASADLWIVNVDGTGLRRLTTLRTDSPMGVFMSDGKRVVVMSAGGIYLVDADGTNAQQIDPTGDHGGLDLVPR